MPFDSTPIIEQAVHDAEFGADDGGEGTILDAGTETEHDTGDTGDTGDEDGGGTPDPVVVPDPVDPAKVPEIDELTQELEAAGIKAPIDGQRENRIPYSRVKKIVDGAIKKRTTAHETAIGETRTKLTAAEARLKNFENSDKLIATDADKYMAMLAVLHPEYKEFVRGGGGAAPAGTRPAVVATTDLGPKPQPDLKYSDGSLGYSPEQLDKRDEWMAKTTAAQVTKDMEDRYTKRFGPIERDWQAQQTVNQQLPIVQARIAAAQALWGKDLFTKHEPEILAFLGANPTVSFDAGVATILAPKLRGERTTMRTEILAEMKARPAAAAATPAAAVAGTVDTGGPKTTEQIIRESIAKLKK